MAQMQRSALWAQEAVVGGVTNQFGLEHILHAQVRATTAFGDELGSL